MYICRNSHNEFTIGHLTLDDVSRLAYALWYSAGPDDSDIEEMREKLDKAVHLDAGEVI